MTTVPPQLQMLLADASGKLARVYPPLAQAVSLVISDLYDNLGLSFGVYMAMRSVEMQAALYAQGRASLATVNQLRRAAGLGAIPPSANLEPVTKLRFGLHNLGLATDLVEDGNPANAGIQWSWRNSLDYLKIGPVAKKYGLEWGGWWRAFTDVPHLEMTGGLSLEYCRALYLRGGVAAVWRAVDAARAHASWAKGGAA